MPLLPQNSLMATFFTSDTHFGHKNVMRYCGRPYATIEEHDQALIDIWNSHVGRGDTVYHLGDFSFRNREQTGLILKQLHGKIIFMDGNHDKNWLRDFVGVTVSDVMMTSINGQAFWLSHYAHKVWPHKEDGTLHLFGHSHDQLLGEPGSMDVGIDTANRLLGECRPFAFSEIMDLLRS